MTGTEERNTSAYHPQLCKRQNRIIKDSLIEVLEEKAEHLTKVINRISFEHRVSAHTSTKYSSFFDCTKDIPFYQLTYCITLQIMKKIRTLMTTIPFNLFFIWALSIREATHDQVSCNIKTAQEKKKRGYKNCHSNLLSTSNIGAKVLLQNQMGKEKSSKVELKIVWLVHCQSHYPN